MTKPRAKSAPKPKKASAKATKPKAQAKRDKAQKQPRKHSSADIEPPVSQSEGVSVEPVEGKPCVQPTGKQDNLKHIGGDGLAERSGVLHNNETQVRSPGPRGGVRYILSAEERRALMDPRTDFLRKPFDSIKRPPSIAEIRAEVGHPRLSLEELEPLIDTAFLVLQVDADIKAPFFQKILADPDVHVQRAQDFLRRAKRRDAEIWDEDHRHGARRALYDDMERVKRLAFAELDAAYDGSQFLDPKERTAFMGMIVKAGARQAALLGVDLKAEASQFTISNTQIVNTQVSGSSAPRITPLEAAEKFGLDVDRLAAIGDQLASVFSDKAQEDVKASRAQLTLEADLVQEDNEAEKTAAAAARDDGA